MHGEPPCPSQGRETAELLVDQRERSKTQCPSGWLASLGDHRREAGQLSRGSLGGEKEEDAQEGGRREAEERGEPSSSPCSTPCPAPRPASPSHPRPFTGINLLLPLLS